MLLPPPCCGQVMYEMSDHVGIVERLALQSDANLADT